MQFLQSVCFVSLSLVSPPLAQESGTVSVQAREQYAQFLVVQARREALVRQGSVRFLERQIRADDNDLLHACSGTFEQSGTFEKWTRRSLPGADLLAFAPKADPKSIASVLASERPAIALFDGERTLRVGPDKKDNQFWHGVLQDGLQPAIRMGALNCGLMLGDQWLSKDLESYTLTSAVPSTTVAGETVYGLTMSAGSEVWTLALRVDADLTLVGLELSKPENPSSVVFEATRLVTFQGERMVEQGNLQVQRGAILHMEFEYLREGLSPSQCSLMTVPSEVMAAKGAMVIVDETTREQTYLGNGAVLERRIMGGGEEAAVNRD